MQATPVQKFSPIRPDLRNNAHESIVPAPMPVRDTVIAFDVQSRKEAGPQPALPSSETNPRTSNNIFSLAQAIHREMPDIIARRDVERVRLAYFLCCCLGKSTAMMVAICTLGILSAPLLRYRRAAKKCLDFLEKHRPQDIAPLKRLVKDASKGILEKPISSSSRFRIYDREGYWDANAARRAEIENKILSEELDIILSCRSDSDSSGGGFFF